MFGKLFGGKKKEENPIHVNNDWASYFCMVDHKHASVRLNLALDEIAPIEGLSTRFWFSVKLLNPDENGFTTNEEFPKICEIEDHIANAVEKLGILMVGAVKSNGTLDLYFYGKNTPDDFTKAIHSVMQNHAPYQFAIDIEEDPEWNDYFNFLFPSEYEYQTILNRKVLYLSLIHI